jgi:uncharacterized membrane protein
MNGEYEIMETRFVTNAKKRTEEAITCDLIIILPRIIILIRMHAICYGIMTFDKNSQVKGVTGLVGEVSNTHGE